jgi:hypothetical protein
MSGYVEAGYAIALVSLSGYSLSIVFRERAARRRLGGSSAEGSDRGGEGQS